MINRRDFIQNSALAGLAVASSTNTHLSAQSRSKQRKMTINLVGGAIGVKASQLQIIEYAHQFGFESVEAQAKYLAGLSSGEVQEIKADLRKKKLVWGTSGLSVDFRKDETLFKSGMKELPGLAAGLKRAGVERVSTWLMPCHDELTYRQNFEQHSKRLREIATVLADYDLRLGLEYVGTTSLMVSRKYPFLHSMEEALELIDSIGTGNVGIVLDSWHWWQAGDSLEQIRGLKNRDIVLVDLNDAPLGVEKQQQQDGRRELPMATGVIDAKGFLDALVAIGYDGPVRAEPFNQPLRDLDDEAACQATVDSLEKAFALIG